MARAEVRTTLMIGAGGTGVSAVSDVLRRAHESLSSPDALGVAAFLGIDASVGEELRLPRTGEERLDELRLPPASFVPLAIPSGELRQTLDSGKLRFLDFVPRRMIAMVNQEAGARATPPLARAAFLLQRSQTRKAIEEHFQRVIDPGNVRRAIDSGVTLTRQSTITVYLVWTSVGGTGNGSAAELVRLIREVARDLKLKVFLTGICILPGAHVTIDDNRRAKANTYAMLKELEAMQSGYYTFSARYSADGPLVTARERFFDAVYLLQNRNSAPNPVTINELPNLIGMVGRYLHALEFTPLGSVYTARFNDAEEALGTRDQYGRTRWVASFGFSSIYQPNREMLEYGAARLAQQVCKALTKQVDMKEAVIEFLRTSGLHSRPGGVLDRMTEDNPSYSGSLQDMIRSYLNQNLLNQPEPQRQMERVAQDIARTTKRALAEGEARMLEEGRRLIAERTWALASSAPQGPGTALSFLITLSVALSNAVAEIGRQQDQLSSAKGELNKKVSQLEGLLSRATRLPLTQTLKRRSITQQAQGELLRAYIDSQGLALRAQVAEHGMALFGALREQVEGRITSLRKLLDELNALQRQFEAQASRFSQLASDYRAPNGISLFKPGDAERYYRRMLAGSASFENAERAGVEAAIAKTVVPRLNTDRADLGQALLADCRSRLRRIDVLDSFLERYPQGSELHTRQLEQVVNESAEFLITDVAKLHGGRGARIRLVGVKGGERSRFKELLGEITDVQDWIFIDTDDDSEILFLQAKIALPLHAVRALTDYQATYNDVSAEYDEEVLHTDPANRLLPELIPAESPADPAINWATHLALATGVIREAPGGGSYLYLPFGERPIKVGSDIRSFFQANQHLLIDLVSQFAISLKQHDAGRSLPAILELRERFQHEDGIINPNMIRELSEHINELKVQAGGR
ncbi:MAG: hypothetical protein HY335_00465 [Deinococcus sp.]|nr:hypothetical protein [Deinococcus sp.]